MLITAHPHSLARSLPCPPLQVEDFSAYAREARADAAARAGGAPPPVFIGGHSLGGLVAALTAAGHASPSAAAGGAGPWAGLVLSSPALDVEWSPMLRVQAAVGGLLAAVVPRARIVPAVRPEDMSPGARPALSLHSSAFLLLGSSQLWAPAACYDCCCWNWAGRAGPAWFRRPCRTPPVCPRLYSRRP